MKIDTIRTTSPQFQRKPNATEMKKYTRALNEGFKVLNKDFGMIIHNSSVPAAKEKNMGIGTLLSTAAATLFLPFLSKHAVNSIQQEPDTYRASYTNSPYSSIAITRNELMIPVEKLATEEYGFLVDEDTVNKIAKSNINKDQMHVDYNKVKQDNDAILREAYNNLQTRSDNYFWGKPLHSKEKVSSVINTIDFEKWKIKHQEDLEPAAIYSALSKKYNNEDWKTWNKIDRNLYFKNNQKEIEKIKSEHKSEIDFYMFKQWLIDKELEKAKANNKNLGIKVLGDSPIAFTSVEVWQNQDLFFEDLSLGCPADDFSADGQRWGFAVLKPETIFNPDGSLGKGGELMKTRYEKMFESSPGGARVDHAIGLIDPFIYTTNEPMRNDNSGRIYSVPNHPLFAKYKKNTDEEYGAIIEKILLPAAAKYGLTKDDIIFEDLGDVTEPVQRILKKFDIGGIAVTEFGYRGADCKENKTIMLGSHDNSSFIEYVNGMFKPEKKWELDNKSTYLAKDTSASGQNIETYKKELMSDKLKFMTACFAELFTSPAKNVQIFFTDFFGIGETYNRPGTNTGCWELRLPDNFENMYYENVKEGKAINLPEAVAIAIRHRGEVFAKTHEKLLKKLDDFSKILKS